MKIVKIILPLISIVLSVAAIVMSGIAIGASARNRIADVYEIGLTDFMEGKVVSMRAVGNEPT